MPTLKSTFRRLALFFGAWTLDGIIFAAVVCLSKKTLGTR